jgi:hypothetical protein
VLLLVENMNWRMMDMEIDKKMMIDFSNCLMIGVMGLRGSKNIEDVKWYGDLIKQIVNRLFEDLNIENEAS